MGPGKTTTTTKTTTEFAAPTYLDERDAKVRALAHDARLHTLEPVPHDGAVATIDCEARADERRAAGGRGVRATTRGPHVRSSRRGASAISPGRRAPEAGLPVLAPL